MIRVLLNNKDLDLFNDEAISLTTRLKDLFDISKIYGDFSRDFSIPASGINNTAIRHFPESSIQYVPGSPEDLRQRQPAEIIIDGIIFRKGALQYRKTIYKYGKMAHHVMTFTSEILGINELFAEDTICDLSELSVFNHSVDADNVREGMDYNGVLFNNKIIYPLISNTVVINQDVLQDGEYTVLEDGSPVVKDLLPTAFRPAIQIQALLAAVNQQYDISFALDPAMNLDDLYMWMSAEPGTSSIPPSVVYDSVVNPPPGPAVGPQDRAAQTNPTTGITAIWDISDFLILYFDFDLTDVDPGTDWKIQAWTSETNSTSDDVWAAVPDFIGATGTTVGKISGTGNGSQIIRMNVYDLFYLYGETFRRYVKFTIETTNGAIDDICVENVMVAENTSNLPEQFWTANGCFNIAPNGESIAKRLPCITILDFITGLMNLYLMVPVSSNLVRTEFVLTAYDNYVANASDWKVTKEIDITEHSIELVPQPKAINLKYQAPKAWKNKRIYLENRGRAYGDYIESIPKGGGEPQEVELPFENLAWIGGVAPASQPYLVGHAFDTEVDYLGTQPHPLFGADLTPIFDSTYLMIWDRSQSPVLPNAGIDVTGFSSNVTQYKLCNSFDDLALDGGIITNTLNFAAEQDFYRYIDRAGSYEVNWFPYMLSLLKTSSRIHRYDAVIEAAKLSQISAGSLLFIHDKWFIINQMVTNTLTKQSKLELVHYYRDYIPSAPIPTLSLPEPPPDVWCVHNDAPTAPSALNATDVLPGSFTLNWTASTSATSTIVKYEIFRGAILIATLVGTPPNVFAGIIGDTTSQTDIYYIRATDAEGLISDFSIPFDFIIDVAPVFNNPVTFSGTTDSTISIDWLAATIGTAPLDRYEIWVDGGYDSTVAPNVLTYVVSGLNPAQSYSIVVKVFDIYGLSDDSSPLMVSTADVPPQFNGVLTEDGLTETTYTIDWLAAIQGTSPLDKYTVYLDGAFVTDLALGVLTYTYTGLTGGTSYSAVVRITADSFAFDESPALVNETVDGGPTFVNPVSPSSITVVGVNLTWPAAIPGNNPISLYEVYIDNVFYASTVNTFRNVAGLTPNTSYDIFVKVVDTMALFDDSAEFTISTLNPQLNQVGQGLPCGGTPLTDKYIEGYGGIQNGTIVYENDLLAATYNGGGLAHLVYLPVPFVGTAQCDIDANGLVSNYVECP